MSDEAYCPGCGAYQPMRMDELGRVPCDCNRTPPLGEAPVNVYACPTCGRYGSWKAGCWGTLRRPHKHAYMRPVVEMVLELREFEANGGRP